MAKYLVSTVETWRVDTEAEAVKLIEEAKAEYNNYALAKYSRDHKERKSKGEVIDEWYKVSLTKIINDEKDPFSNTKVWYGEREFEGDF